MSQLTAKVNDSNAEQLGTDTFEVTAHGEHARAGAGA